MLLISGGTGSSLCLCTTLLVPVTGDFVWICRYSLLAGAAFSQGLTLGPLVSMALAVHPGVLFTAFLATAASFACFSGVMFGCST